MKKNFLQSIIIYIVLLCVLMGSGFEVYANWQKARLLDFSQMSDYEQPPILAGNTPWSVRSIDTQVVSKHWPNVSEDAIAEQVKLLADLGVNYVAIGTPYDKVGEMKLWAKEIHKQKMHVWFRSHWDQWEGDDGQPGIMTPEEYLDKTSQFIAANPSLFVAGDAFTVAVEPEQVGIGLGKRFLTWDQYRSFITSQVTVSNAAFNKIGLKGKIYTNWISVNGWVVENEFNNDLVKKLGLITVDHYVGQSRTIGDYSDAKTIAKVTVEDLDRFHSKFNVPILLGEWGYQIFQPVPDDVQANVINELYKALSTKNYILGINYWTHVGNSAAIIGDQFGSNLKYRQGALVIKSYYDPLNLIPLPVVKK